MRYFAFHGFDAPGREAVRASLRETHRSYIRQDRPDCRAVLGGPLMDDTDERMIGTLLVLEATDRSAALRFLSEDPYARAGLFARSELHLWRWGLGQPS